MFRIAGRTLVILTFVHVPPLLAQQPAPVPYRTPEEQARLDVASLVRANNHAGADLFSRLPATPGNTACSPYALTETLALVSIGAKNQTRTELDRTLSGLSETRLQRATLTLIKDMAVENPVRAGELRRSGTGLWTAANTRFAPSFLDLARRYYPEGLNSVAANDTIRAAAPADLGQDMPAVEAARDAAVPAALLVSSAGFKGVWANPFPKSSTKEGSFQGDKKAQLMRQTAVFGYAETPEMQILELPYADRDLRLMVILPRNAAGLADLEKSLTLDRLTRLSSGLTRREVDVTLPRFQVVVRLRLRSELERLGIHQAFTPQAQFAGLTAEKQPRLEQVLQDVSFEVDEGYSPKGPLPTPTLVEPKAPPKPPDDKAPEAKAPEPSSLSVKVDRPFLFVLRDFNRGGIVFIGRITDPNIPAK